MTVDAYYYAVDQGPKPRELRLVDFISKFGAQAVLGRPMYAREIYRCNVAENVYRVKTKSMNTDDWAKWAEKNPKDVELLANVEKLIAEIEDNAG